MEFVLVSSDAANARAESIQRALTAAPRLATVDGPLHLINVGGLIIAASGPRVTPKQDSAEHSLTFWDGHGVANGQAFSSGISNANMDTPLHTYIDACLSGLQTDTRGVFCAARVNVNSKAFTVAVDPLSQYPLFVCQIGHTLITGNSIYLIEAAARGLGFALTRSARSGILETAFGIGAGIDTGFKEVQLLPGNHIITGIGVNSRLVPVSNVSAYADMSYEDLVESASQRLTDYISAIKRTSSSRNIFFDLTGGLDSRLTFAAAIGCGFKSPKFFAGGADTSQDKQIAHLIAAQYNAKPVNFPENHDNEHTTYTALARRAVFRSHGSSNLYAYSLGSQRIQNANRIRGGGGEIARSFLPPLEKSFIWNTPVRTLGNISSGEPVFSACLSAHLRNFSDKKAQAAAHWAYRYCKNSKAHHRLYRPQCLRQFTGQIIEGLHSQATSLETIGMDYYVHERCRRHFGFMSRGLNMAYGAFEPLLDPMLLAAANKLPFKDRAAGKLTFDLIEKMAGKQMLEIPFAHTSLAPHIRRELARRLDVKEKSLSFNPAKTTLLKTTPLFSNNTPNIQSSEPTPPHFGPRASALWHKRSYFAALASGLRADSEFWHYVNRSTLLHTLSYSDYFFKNETTAMRGTRLLHTLIWMSGEEDTTSITTLR